MMEKSYIPWETVQRKRRFNQNEYDQEFSELVDAHKSKMRDNKSKNQEGFQSLVKKEINIYDQEGNMLSLDNSLYKNFYNFPLHQTLLENLSYLDFIETTPIQKTVIPLILKDRNMIACAQTGSGKTIAFLLPIIDKMLKNGKPSLDPSHQTGKSAIIIIIIL